MAFSFTTRLDRGKNGSRSINGLLDSLVSAIDSALLFIFLPESE